MMKLFSVIGAVLCTAVFVTPALGIQPATAGPATALGPMLGTPEPTGIVVWYRSGLLGEHLLTVRARHGDPVSIESSDAIDDSDRTTRWHVGDLEPDTEYTYDIVLPDGRVIEEDDFVFRTPAFETSRRRVAVGFASRAPTEPTHLWTRMQAERLDAAVLLGDSPVIGTTDLETARARQRALLGVPQFARLVRSTPTLAIWDDLDFGAPHADGNLADKYNTRQAFTEYHASKAFGRFDEGVYTSFRVGPAEVFLLDTRYFANIENATVAPSEPSLIGHEQWDWLLQGLTASTAEFKIVASGRVWDIHPNGSGDDWHAYAYERDPLLRTLGQERVQGVVLVSGDFGASRAVRYPMSEVLGYDAWHLIPGSVDPSRVESEPRTHAMVLHESTEPEVFMKVVADNTVSPATLEVHWITSDGRRLFGIETDSASLRGEVPLDRPR